MTEREAFIEAIATNPGEDTPRLAFADWLQEHGEEPRAEFIRLQCAPARHPYNWNNPERERATHMLARHLPEWFGELFRAVGMPVPTGTHRPRTMWDTWRYGPYALRYVWGPEVDAIDPISEGADDPMTEGVLVRFAEEEVDPPDNAPPPRPVRFLDYLGFDRGFVTTLNVALAHRTAGCSLARAFRLEPVHRLALGLAPNPGHWRALTDPCLHRVRELRVWLLGSVLSAPDHADALGAVLDDPALAGVRELVFEGEDLRSEYEREEHSMINRYAPPALVERMLQTEVANVVARLRLVVGRDGTRAFASGAALTNLRSLDLSWNHLEKSDRVALNQYRGRLEALNLAGNANDPGPLLDGPPWARLTHLTLSDTGIGAREVTALARPDLFPALERLCLTGYVELAESALATLADAFRNGGFALLTHLTLPYHVPEDGTLALAAAVAPTQLRELDLRATYRLSDEVKDRIRALLGDRVLLNPHGENDTIPF